MVRLVPHAIEVDIAHDREIILTRAFETDDEALAWADGKRVAREEEGWQAKKTESAGKVRLPSH